MYIYIYIYFWKIIKVSIKEIELSIYMNIHLNLMSYVWYKSNKRKNNVLIIYINLSIFLNI
jgi:hypothetical protein